MENLKKYVAKFDIENPFGVEIEGFDEDKEYQVELDMFKFRIKKEAENVAKIFNEMFKNFIEKEKEKKVIKHCHLIYDMREAYESGAKKHPQLTMKELGITYQVSTPQSIADCWWFWNCENVPEELPCYLKVYNLDPMKNIGNGIGEKDAIKIRDYYNIENGLYWVKDNGKWTVAIKGDEGWHLWGCEHTMEEVGYAPLEEIGEKIVRNNVNNGLLKKYIAHIIDEEGRTYLTDTEMECSSENFTDEEIKILRKLAE